MRELSSQEKRDLARCVAGQGEFAAFCALIGYRPHEAQREVHNCRAPRRVVRWGRRAGKTLLAAVEAAYCLLQDDQRVWVVAPDHELTGRVWDEVTRILCDELGFEPTVRRDTAPRKLAFPWGAVCEGKSTENAAQKNLVGAGVNLLVWDEVAKSPPNIWERQLHANLADRHGRALLISTPEGYNHFYKLWQRGNHERQVRSDECEVRSGTAETAGTAVRSDECEVRSGTPEQAAGDDESEGRGPAVSLRTSHSSLRTAVAVPDPDWQSFHAPSSVNPHLPQSAIDEARRTYSPEAFAQEWEARFTQFSGQVYGEFEESVHVRPLQYNPDWPLALAFDFGVENPFVCLWLQFTPEDHVHILAEYVRTGETTLTNGQRVMVEHRRRGYGPITWAAADPSAKDARLTLRRHCGIATTFRRLTGRSDRLGERQAGIERVRQLLREERLLVAPECERTIEEFNLYRYPEPTEGTNAPEEPEKANDHCLDALRYAIVVWLPRTPERRRLRGTKKGPLPFRTAREKVLAKVADGPV